MNLIYHVLSVLTSTLFIFYGASCLWSAAMKAEFERFGLSRYRLLSGVLEILGALGLALGFFFPSLRVAAASGLALLMVQLWFAESNSAIHLASFFQLFFLPLLPCGLLYMALLLC